MDAQTSPVLPQRALTPVRVVLAEDDDLVRTVVAAALRKEGCDVILTRNGGALGAQLEVMMAVSDAPTLVVSDDRMPGTSGLSVFERVRAWGWNMPLLLITGFADEDVIARARRAGVHILQKPVTIATLRDLVRVMLRGEMPVCAHCGATCDLHLSPAMASEFLCAECQAWWDDEPTNPGAQSRG